MKLIIFGTKGKKNIIGKGKFYCPSCQRERPYEHIKVTEHFSLYFLPVFKLKELGEYVACTVCQTKFEKSVINLKAPVPRSNSVFCATCNLELPESFSFCPNCGERLG